MIADACPHGLLRDASYGNRFPIGLASCLRREYSFELSCSAKSLKLSFGIVLESLVAKMTSIHAIRRQRINAFNVFILLFVGLGSMTYGYTASIIGTTLGKFPLN